MSVLKYALRVEKNQTLNTAVSAGQYGVLDYYLDEAGCYEPDTVLFVPAYRLEEVEEVIEPEKPGVPVEPYVGMVIPFGGERGQYVVCGQVNGEWCLLTFFSNGDTEMDFISDLPAFLPHEYPRTPSTPAVTRKVKKWVKIEPPSDSPEC